MLPAMRETFSPRQRPQFRSHRPHGSCRKTNLLLLLMIAVAMVSALGVGTIITAAMQKKTETTATVAVEAPSRGVYPVANANYLYVPTVRIAGGAQLKAEYFKQVRYPVNSIPQGAVVSLDQLGGRYALHPLAEGAPILLTSISDELKVNPLGIESGLRAMSIEVDSVTGVEGHLQVGSNVDLVWTYVDYEGTLKTVMLVENRRVLSYGGSTEKRRVDTREAPQVHRTVTLELGGEEAMGVLAAKRIGELQLMIRSPDDDSVIGRQSVTMHEVSQSKRESRGNRRRKVRYCTSTPGSRVPLGTRKYSRGFSDPRNFPESKGTHMRAPGSSTFHNCTAPTFSSIF